MKYQTLHSKRTFHCLIFFVKNNSSIFCRDILRETTFETVWLTKLSLCHAGSTRDKILPGLPAILAGFPACLETGDVSFCMRDLIITIARIRKLNAADVNGFAGSRGGARDGRIFRPTQFHDFELFVVLSFHGGFPQHRQTTFWLSWGNNK